MNKEEFIKTLKRRRNMNNMKIRIRGSIWYNLLGEEGCRRRAYYEIIDAPKEEIYSPDMQRGIDLEETVYRKFFEISEYKKPAGRWRQKAYEREEQGIVFTGHIDGACEKDGNLYVLEVKCPQPKIYKNYIKEIPLYYQYQMQQYIWLGGFAGGVFVAYNSLNAGIVYHQILPDKEIISNIISESVKMKDLIEKQKIPDRQYSMNSLQCQYCGYRKECYKDFKIIKTDEVRDITNDKELLDVANKYYAEQYVKVQKITKLITKGGKNE